MGDAWPRRVHQSIASEPWDAEFCAMYFGNQSYRSETPAYRQQIRKLFKDGQRVHRLAG